MALTDTKIKNTKSRERQYKLPDQGGMYLLITPSGGKCWRYDFRFNGKRKTLSIGTYPEISLLEARGKLLEAKKNLIHGIDPSNKRRSEKQKQNDASNSFKNIAVEWYDRVLPTWTPGHAITIKSRLERDVFPWIGQQPIKDISPPDVLKVLRRVESRGAIETAHRIKTICGQVFRYAVATGRADRDPTADLKGALTPVQHKHMAALTDSSKFAELLRAMEAYKGSFIVKCALQIQAYTFVRPGELRHAEWQEINFETDQWNIPGEKMKIRLPHVVPLAKQVVDILKQLHQLTGTSRYVFPNGRSFTRPLSENGILAALRNLGFGKDQMTGHGFRAAARTILDEVLQQRVDLIEHQLAHAVKDPNGRAYNRTAHLEARKAMMQLWADYIDGLKAGAKVLPIKRVSGE